MVLVLQLYANTKRLMAMPEEEEGRTVSLYAKLAAAAALLFLLNKFVTFMSPFSALGIVFVLLLTGILLSGISFGTGARPQMYKDEPGVFDRGGKILIVGVVLLVLEFCIPYNTFISFVGLDAGDGFRMVFRELAERLFMGFEVVLGVCVAGFIGVAYVLLFESYVTNNPVTREKVPRPLAQEKRGDVPGEDASDSYLDLTKAG